MHRNDSADMPIDERLDEVASLVGMGFLRLMLANAEGGLSERVHG